ncbi:hypothetical protein KAX97_08405 [candidate division WOR-3 bacterium]|nr:hypothetical protein [candidate division WOR-3 bacterium]
MKKLFIIMAMLFIISSVDARMLKRALIEIGPKASLYIKNEDVQFGIGVEVVVNPLRSVGFRFNLTEIRFDPTTFHFNREGSLDAFIYLPMKGLQLYVHSGVGLKTHETGAGTQTRYSIQGGLGLNYPLNPRTCLFVEPGIIISGNGETDVSFRVSAGGRFGIIK